ncbi:hypothetical protein GSI_09019 [Ganoderma sinense ZZ0214-1]|uniref:Uncharacterized protein n=1 Tax=Ganoderma sinense ZZ0214-1 TaxID=1077348 RepID=A0A2G8S5C2_9APHY|nr:hypothetical protein GSI_09019 [Ganoderma sinense ZZ0214-1]
MEPHFVSVMQGICQLDGRIKAKVPHDDPTTSADLSPATFNEESYRFYVHVFQEQFATIGLLVGFYGVLIVLTSMSIYALVTQCTKKTQVTTIILSLTIFALFTSTTIYTVTSILSTQTVFSFDLIYAGPSLWTNSNLYFAPDVIAFVEDYTQLNYCSSTAALTLNITLGDAIVCWRALTLIGEVRTYMVGFMYEGFPAGIAACVLSLTTNLVATILIGVKAWESRKRLRGYLVAGPRAAQVEKLFALLIESGALYSALWVVIVGFQVGQYRFIQTASLDYQEGFFDIVGVIMNGCLVPLMAMYPTVIIVLVGLKRSHIERGLSQHVQSLPTPHLSLVGDTHTPS